MLTKKGKVVKNYEGNSSAAVFCGVLRWGFAVPPRSKHAGRGLLEDFPRVPGISCESRRISRGFL
ncbi:MAG: hypothetical protein D6679_14560 [Candidatus Hydrogenedentota bacterium]|nr:MAG: hypothetical protein D6679_14560 [Candidatus Hydrogenedentota bacterium]